MTSLTPMLQSDVLALSDGLQDCVPAEWGPQRMDCGMLELAIKDPDGYLPSFGQEVAVPATESQPA